jgi:hypothetical protein
MKFRVTKIIVVCAMVLVWAALSYAQVGRYQYIPSPQGMGGSVLLDTVTGCTWYAVHDPNRKRYWLSFLERAAIDENGKTVALIPRECAPKADGYLDAPETARPLDVPTARPK